MRYQVLLISIALSILSLSAFTSGVYIQQRPKPPHPVIQEFQDAIESDPELLVGFGLMFDQIPRMKRYELESPVFDYHTMLSRLNDILTMAPTPEITSTFPMATLFRLPMCTQAGFDMFMNAKVNAHLKRILNTWAQFLTSPASRYVLTKDAGGWFSANASKDMPNFAETYECNPDEEYFGFASWDDFFTRKFRDGVRPVDSPEDEAVITNACESLPFRVQRDVKAEDMFWLKGQPYSLKHMLNNDPLAIHFIGGTVLQGFLAGKNYHRWHSPVDGTIVKIESVPGTYFAIPPTEALAVIKDPSRFEAELILSQAFMSSVATRSIIFIQADNPDISLMAFVAIGMEEVSSCETTVKVGDRVKKGDQLGMFHYGGSTYSMIFQPETKIEFTEEVRNAIEGGIFVDWKAMLVNKRVGVVRSNDARGPGIASSEQQQQWST